MSNPVDGNGKELHYARIYRRVNDQLFPLARQGTVFAEKIKVSEETKYENVGGVMVRIVIPIQSKDPKPVPPNMNPVEIMVMMALGGRPGVDSQTGEIDTTNMLVREQIELVKKHEFTDDEIALLNERLNYNEAKIMPLWKRLDQLRNEDKLKAEQAIIQARNAASEKFFFENLPNKRKFSCGHVADRRNIADMASFKKDKEFAYCQHGCKDGKIPLGELF